MREDKARTWLPSSPLVWGVPWFLLALWIVQNLTS